MCVSGVNKGKNFCDRYIEASHSILVLDLFRWIAVHSCSAKLSYVFPYLVVHAGCSSMFTAELCVLGIVALHLKLNVL